MDVYGKELRTESCYTDVRKCYLLNSIKALSKYFWRKFKRSECSLILNIELDDKNKWNVISPYSMFFHAEIFVFWLE